MNENVDENKTDKLFTKSCQQTRLLQENEQ
jgi:hypothetical protein